MKRNETTRIASGCPGWEELVDYFRHRLPEPRMLAIEAHFGTCELCVEETRLVFETLVDLDSWTPESVGAAARREALVSGLAQAEEDEQEGSEWARRIRRWRQGIAHAAYGGIELIIGASGARIVTQTLRELVAPSGIQFEPLVALRGPADQGTAALDRLEEPGTVAVLSVEKPDVRVSVREGNKIVVTLQSWPEDRLPPGILVIETRGNQRPLRLELKRGDGSVYKAEFTRDTGKYMVLFAPIERKS